MNEVGISSDFIFVFFVAVEVALRDTRFLGANSS